MARRRLSVLVVILVFIVVMPDRAFAYLDPGGSNVLVQGLMAVVGSIVTTTVFYRRAVTDFVRRLFGRGVPPDSPERSAK